jgi:protein SCO1/2
MANRRTILISLGALVLAGAVGVGASFMRGPDTPAIGGPFTLVNGAGETVRDTDMRGKYMLVYFGYTFCPDICPTALGGLGTALDMLPQEQLDKVQPIFISVDPKRDHGEDLAAYSQAFHPTILGLTGPMDEINRVAAAYGARFAVHGDPESDDYSIDHTSIIYVMDPEGRFLTQFTHNASPDSMLAKLTQVVK